MAATLRRSLDNEPPCASRSGDLKSPFLRSAGWRPPLPEIGTQSPRAWKLGQFYGVETKSLSRAVKRNADRFPKDFVFQLTREEFEALRYQIGTSSSGHRGRRRPLYVFTGVNRLLVTRHSSLVTFLIIVTAEPLNQGG
jgi:ORF6N domain